MTEMNAPAKESIWSVHTGRRPVHEVAVGSCSDAQTLVAVHQRVATEYHPYVWSQQETVQVVSPVDVQVQIRAPMTLSQNSTESVWLSAAPARPSSSPRLPKLWRRQSLQIGTHLRHRGTCAAWS